MEAILNLQNRCSNLRVQLLQNLAQWIKKSYQEQAGNTWLALKEEKT